MKQSKFVIAMELATIGYMAAVIWLLFPGCHGFTRKAWKAGVYRWRLGRDQVHFAGLPLWAQEMAQVRGRFEPRERAPRPLNLPL